MTRPLREHAPISGFPAADGCLTIGGVKLTRLAELVGRTPFYAYDRALIAARVAELRQYLPKDIHLHYAIKANPMPAVAQHLRALVDGFDVASAGEMRVALNTGMAPASIGFAGPGKSAAELAQAVAAGVTVTLESQAEMQAVAMLARRAGVAPRVLVRVNPDFELKAAGMQMGGGAKPFGVDAELVPAMLAAMRPLHLAFAGFHIFAGSQNLKAEAIAEAQRRSVELAARLAVDAPSPVTAINLGGGFGIPYFPGDMPLDLAAVGANLAELMPVLRRALPEARPVIELGRYIVGEAGIYVCRVQERKESRGQVFLITDGGLHHHLAASGNFGQVIRKNYPLAVANRAGARDLETVSVVGPLCTPLDVLGDKIQLPRAEVGDLIVVFQSGAYGLTASPTAFLSHPPPAEVLV
jgi:diaminopimelate decarboxylase